ncbi:MAG: ATP-binding protein [Peptococcaceae bacterium]|nr:ATP-binding protein [Peptococcaceae bacterium]MDH7524873.1 ATP-binding protein [Peptococcaceae bacterium]
MFNRLRMSLTMINVLVVGLILVVILSGVYLVMEKNIVRGSEQMMRLIVAEEAAGSPAPIRERYRRAFNYVYVRTGTSGQLIDFSGNLPLTSEQLELLTTKAARAGSGKNRIVEDSADTYRFLKYPAPSGETSYVFISTRQEKEILRNLLAALTITGLAGLGLTFFGSLFLAHRALIPVKKAWEQQKNFLADASHELRTPLAVIQTNLDLVMGNPLETVKSQGKWLDNIKTELKSLTKLVDNMLFLARADSHHDSRDVRLFSLGKALQEALQSFEPLAVKKGVKFDFTLPALCFTGDETRIKQLLGILIDNALKYTPAGGRISVNLRDIGSKVEITVQDTGEGIEPEHLTRIFERFYRVDKARDREKGGTGLGLAIAECIVKEHRGNIRASSIPGQGTTFTVLLPNPKH